MLFSPSRPGRETSRLSFPPHLPVNTRNHSREIHVCSTKNAFLESSALFPESWKRLTSSRALVHQLRAVLSWHCPRKRSGWRRGTAPLRHPVAAICSGAGACEHCDTCSPPSLLIGEASDQTSAGQKFCPQQPPGLNQVQKNPKNQPLAPQLRDAHMSSEQINFPPRNLLGESKSAPPGRAPARRSPAHPARPPDLSAAAPTASWNATPVLPRTPQASSQACYANLLSDCRRYADVKWLFFFSLPTGGSSCPLAQPKGSYLRAAGQGARMCPYLGQPGGGGEANPS